jgi:phenylpropionate dioxygenase-like ring-hydroxylating dioxygenase large terminal subunit
MEQPSLESRNLGALITSAVLCHYWHPVARSSEVSDKPFKAKLLNQPLVLWRSNGTVAAFYDLCIHRGTPLSLGWITDGELVCAYHGWRYAANGSCTRIPALPPDRAIPSKARASSFKAEERYGLIWVCLGQPRAEIPEFPPEFNDTAFRWGPYSTDGFWKANAARMLENLADYSHFPWVHPGTLGDPDNPESEPISIEPLDGGFQYDIPQPVNRLRPDEGARQTYKLILPFMLVIQRWQPGGSERQTNIFLCCPVSKNETRFFRFMGRNFVGHLSDEELGRRHRLTFEQDRAIVESQRPEELPLDLSEELHLRGPDAPAIEYRRQLRELGVDWNY